MIRTLANTLLNLEPMLSQQAVHIALSLPLNHSSGQCIFINTCHMEEQTLILKPPVLSKQESDDYEDVMCHSIIDYDIQHPLVINHICLAKFVSGYMKNGTHLSKRKKTKVLCSIRYKKNTLTVKIIVENGYCYMSHLKTMKIH